MPSQSGDRSEFFPAIEKKYGKPIQYWISQLQDLESTKYPDQIALLRENFEFMMMKMLLNVLAKDFLMRRLSHKI
jgi:hypothetical protein